MRRCLLPLLVLLLPRTALALTSPLPGAVPLPAGFVLRLPFEKGVNVKVLSGYGPNAGSSLHKDTDATGKANDHYALDLVLPDYPSSGKGQPVLASASGTVVKAGWATVGWANYGQRVIIRHDFNDGHTYHSIYCHLNAVSVKEGDHLEAGQALGELGQSCQGALSCGSFSTPHLHWALHQDSTIGGSGTGGSYAGHAVVPEFIDGYENLLKNMIMESGNASVPKPPCLILPPAGGTLDDMGPCFSKGGSPDYWFQASQGHAGHLWWTNATSDANPDNTARWDIHLEAGGPYHVEVSTEPSFALSTQAKYRLRHGGQEAAIVLDQTKGSGWQSLGTFDFVQGGDQWVRLDDNTGEPVSQKHKLVFDAVRLSPPGSGQGGSGGSGQSGSGGSPQAGSGGNPSAGSGGSPQAGSGGSEQAGSGGSSQAGSGGSAQAGSGGSSGQGGSGNAGGSAQAGSGGSPQAGSGGGSQAGQGGNAQAGNGGSGGSAQGGSPSGTSGQGGQPAKAGGGGKSAGASGKGVTVTQNSEESTDEGSCSATPGRGNALAGVLVALLGLAAARRRR